MFFVVLGAGVLLTAAGAALIGFGIPINELALGSTMILAGTVAVVGGLVLIGLAAVLMELARLGSAMKMAAVPALATAVSPDPVLSARPVHIPEKAPEPVIAREAEPPKPIEVPAPAAAAPVEVSASAIERLRSTIPRPPVSETEEEAVPLSPNGQHAAQHVATQQPSVVEAPAPEPVPRSAGAAAVETREPRLDFLFRPRPTRAAPQQEAFDSLWPKRPARDAQPDSRAEVARAPAGAAPAAEASPPQRSVAILKSGVVDGMAYTLYADGSIEAQLPRGTVRFSSIAELRAHIESNA